MFISILHNSDHTLLTDDPGREAREDVVRVAAAVREALHGEHIVDLVGVGRDLFSVQTAFEKRRPDVVINLCESLAADSRGEMLLPALLELLGVSYTGSSALALALALHKNKAKEILRARGVPTPDFRVVEHVEELPEIDLAFPVIVKPSREDASMGIDFDSVVRDRQSMGKAVARAIRTFRQPALLEQYIEGREIYVPLLGNGARRALPLTEIRFGESFANRPRVLSYRAKWDTTSEECIDSPSAMVSLPPALEARCVEVALAAFAALECRDYGRVDLRVDADGNPFVIDINPNCDLHPQAGFAKAAFAAGISYSDLAIHLVELALERRHGHQTPRSVGSNAARRAPQPHRDVHTGRTPVRARAHRRSSAAR
jgi:D-alanine-D-alanine ligase